MTVRRFAPLRSTPSRVALLGLFPVLVGLACSSPDGSKLFTQGDAKVVASQNTAGSSAPGAGTGSVGSDGPAQTGGGSSGSLGVDSVAGGAIAGNGTQGGSAGTGGSGGSGSTASGGTSGCETLENPTVNDANGHCYAVNPDLLTFPDARDACEAHGGYLVTATSEEENKFVADMLTDAHWLGASDGRPDRTAGVGTYTWVNGEEWSYDDWDGGQPNAVATNCPDENSGSHCYEHCAYQAAGGGWIDRACFHTIPSICEWDTATK